MQCRDVSTYQRQTLSAGLSSECWRRDGLHQDSGAIVCAGPTNSWSHVPLGGGVVLLLMLALTSRTLL
jgi:hypothetical protein